MLNINISDRSVESITQPLSASLVFTFGLLLVECLRVNNACLLHSCAFDCTVMNEWQKEYFKVTACI